MGESVQSYRDLIAWDRAYQLGLVMYQESAKFPREERFGLTAQIRRAIVAVASNIAEGYGRGTTVDYLRFLRMARGSLYEADTQWEFALGLGYISHKAYDDVKWKINETERILAGLIRSIQRAKDKQNNQAT